jgi:uncharacterized protein (TIGR00251 family)
MIQIAEHAQGCILPVRAQPGARKAGILGEYAGALKVAVTAPPEDGRANKALAELLARTLNLKRSQVKLLSGETSREKRFIVGGIAKSKLERWLAAFGPGSSR